MPLILTSQPLQLSKQLFCQISRLVAHHISCPHSSPGSRKVAIVSTQAGEGHRRCDMSGISPGTGTAVHTVLRLDSSTELAGPKKGEGPGPWLPAFFPTHLLHSFSPPETVKGLYFLWTQYEAEMSKIWCPREHFWKGLLGVNIKVNTSSFGIHHLCLLGNSPLSYSPV